MQSCPVCGTQVAQDQSFCNRCGARLIPSANGSTVSLNSIPLGTSRESDAGRFPTGTVLAQRYRIVHLLGRGGMGEVYRADDLLLGQPVALKFLPNSAAHRPAALERLRNEVRIARQISHPNVCRVYDLGEVAGLTYLTMEYIDGEDLASLLRRIGRLPQEKALEIARKLCAGLAAAHDTGIIHCDLKPANIMLDGKGRARVTDFGLAGFAEEMRDAGGGTLAYMAPEQRAGRQVTARSDIYALGIVLHEVFTGRQPSRERKSTELDPTVERVILRCLEEDPQMRPASALSVAAALPGGDPLKAALAAGEIPSPEIVASAGAAEGLRTSVAITCLAAIIISIVAFYFLQQRRALVEQIPLENSPEVLAAQARHIANSLGYTERPVDKAFGWEYDVDGLQYLAAQKQGPAREARIKANRPACLYFWYRESPHYLYHPTGNMVTRRQPDSFDPGMLELLLDSEGRLIEFNAQPPAEISKLADTLTPDWGGLFAAAALDGTRLTPVQPLLTPRTSSDTRAAWVGSSDQVQHDQLRLEAAAYQGRPVFFRIVGPWSRPVQTGFPPLADFKFPVVLLFAVVLPIGAGLLAWRNSRIGRGDRRGSFRLASFVLTLVFLRDIAWQHHVPTIAEAGLIFFALQDAVMFGAISWVLYMAFEPFVRKRLPTTLISWSRLLAGRFRDPVVGADLLVGAALGGVALCVVRSLVSPFVASLAPPLMATVGGWVSLWCGNAAVALYGSLSCVFLLSLMLLLVRVQWLAALVSIGLISLVSALPGAALSMIVLCGFTFLCLLRLGLLSTVALLYVYNIGATFPPPTSLSLWYSDATLLATASVLVLAIYAFHTTLAGRPLWRHKLHEF